jgi:DNA-nicking Smr family endonuclease
LSDEDEALWKHTAATLQPLQGKKSRHHPGVADPDETPPFEPKAKAAKKGTSQLARSQSQTMPPPSPAPPPPSKAPALNTFERKAARRLGQGKMEIEARLDLHGMRQHEAHLALRRFLLTSYSRGLRWVLVITGKGGPRRPHDDEDFGYATPERGVLRKNVPMWLTEPELRAVVVSYTAAAIPHGGEGALYVQLRNPDRVR